MQAIFVMHRLIIVTLVFRLNMSLFVSIMIAEELKHVFISIIHNINNMD